MGHYPLDYQGQVSVVYSMVIHLSGDLDLLRAAIEDLLQSEGQLLFDGRVLLGLGPSLHPTERGNSVCIQIAVKFEEICRECVCVCVCGGVSCHT